jgi:hypothetical protein
MYFSCKNYPEKAWYYFVKVVEFFTRNPTKLGFNFSDFLRFLQDSAPSRRSRRDSFTNRPSNFADRPSGRKIRLQLGPWRHGRRRELNSGEGKARLGRERAGECSGAHLQPITGVGRLWGRAGEGARRHQPPMAAATGLLTNRTLDLEHKRPGEL